MQTAYEERAINRSGHPASGGVRDPRPGADRLMTRAKLSRAEMVRLWRDGMTGVEIAKLAGITAQAVSYHVKKVVGGAKERSRKKVAATMKGKT
jgi:DNA-binding CsgD family transcriptional regulator